MLACTPAWATLDCPGRFLRQVLSRSTASCSILRNVSTEGQQLYFLNTENCLIFASAEGDDSERMRGCGGEGE